MKKVIPARDVIVYIALFILFTPAYFLHFPQINVLIKLLRMLVWAAVIALFFVKKLYRRNLEYNIALLAFCAVMLIATAFGSNDYYACIREIIGYVLVGCFLIQELLDKESARGFDCLMRYFFVCVLINTLTVILFPGGMYPNNRGVWVCWFMGEDNFGYGYYILASVLVLLYDSFKKRVSVFSVITWICSFYFVFSNKIGTGIICELSLFALYIIKNIKYINKTIKLWVVSALLIVPYIVLVYIRNLGFLKLILDALHKDIYFSGRTIMWDQVLVYVREHFVIGNGVYDTSVFQEMFMPGKGLTHAHNLMLQYHFWGGLLALLIFIGIIQIVIHRTRTVKNSDYYRICTIGLIVMALRFVLETSCKDLFWILLTLLICWKQLEGKGGEIRPRLRFVLKK